MDQGQDDEIEDGKEPVHNYQSEHLYPMLVTLTTVRVKQVGSVALFI